MGLAERFDTSGVQAVALMGSHARGDAGPYSDVDLVRLVETAEVEGAGSYLIDDRLVVVSNVTREMTERWFTDPAEAVTTIAGLRTARALLDPHGRVADLQSAADAYAGAQMVGLIEEAHKGLEGLRRNDVGRLLNAQFGLSWLLSQVMQVQRGVLIEGDNGFYRAMIAAMGAESRWSDLYRRAYGVEQGDLRDAVTAGLLLYCECAGLLDAVLSDAERVMVRATVARIEAAL